ncbi:MAG TPA: cupin domain-containing protein [Acidimicrobiales bacterium]|nr:cupin domain-containing protein [Acidimicrobiales bacterium]
MPQYRRVGDVPAKRHVVHQSPTGRLAEELMGEEGFSGASSLLYHRSSPSAILSAEAIVTPRECPTPNEALRPLHLRLGTFGEAGDPVTGRRSLLGNADLTIAWVHATQSSELYRNAAGDEVAFVAEGRGVLESVFGRLEVGPGDYVVVPASTTHRWVVGAAPMRMLVLEATGHMTIPARYLTPTGQLREGAPYSERDLRGPDEPLTVDGEEVPVLIRHRSGWSRHVHACHPFDVVGWDGCVYPFAFSIGDFEPMVGRLHQPPPVHQTFAGPGFVVCSFVPRLLDFDPDAVRVPYHHANVDSDEVLFYVDGDFTSRKGAGIEPNSLTLHPAGFVHGPQPGSAEAAAGASRTDETAVMVDTFRPLGITPGALGVSDDHYLRSWARPVRP